MTVAVLDATVSGATLQAGAVSLVTAPSPLTLVEEEDDRNAVGPYRQWNPSAVSCYLRNANCEGCFYQKFFEPRQYGCNMAEAVQHLLKRVGPPDQRRIERCV